MESFIDKMLKDDSQIDTEIPTVTTEETKPKLTKKFRVISSIVEYVVPNELCSRFGIIDYVDYNWKPLNGKMMLTLTAKELRNLADVIDKKSEQ